MQLLGAQEVKKKRTQEETDWKSKITKAQRQLEQLENRIRLANSDLGYEKLQRLEEYERFCKQLDDKKKEKLLDYQILKERITALEDTIDNISRREDKLTDKEEDLRERERILADRERFILAAERRINDVNLHGK